MVVTVDFLSQIPRMLRELVALVQDPSDRRQQRRSDFFDREIAPAHADMVAINKDYMESFVELRDLLRSGEDLERAIELLKMKRLVFLNQRKDREAFADALAEVKKSGYLKQRELAAFVDYCEGIRKYLSAASPGDARVSWYSAFIQGFESRVRMGESPHGQFFNEITTSRPPVEMMCDAYSDAVQTDIPDAWKQYSGAYHKLRLELTR
jgi:hypothetical protein